MQNLFDNETLVPTPFISCVMASVVRWFQRNANIVFGTSRQFYILHIMQISCCACMNARQGCMYLLSMDTFVCLLFFVYVAHCTYSLRATHLSPCFLRTFFNEIPRKWFDILIALIPRNFSKEKLLKKPVITSMSCLEPVKFNRFWRKMRKIGYNN